MTRVPSPTAIVGKRSEIGAAGLAIAAGGDAIAPAHSEIGAARFAIAGGHTEIRADNHAVMRERREIVAARSETGGCMIGDRRSTFGGRMDTDRVQNFCICSFSRRSCASWRG